MKNKKLKLELKEKQTDKPNTTFEVKDGFDMFKNLKNKIKLGNND